MYKPESFLHTPQISPRIARSVVFHSLTAALLLVYIAPSIVYISHKVYRLDKWGAWCPCKEDIEAI